MTTGTPDSFGRACSRCMTIVPSPPGRPMSITITSGDCLECCGDGRDGVGGHLDVEPLAAQWSGQRDEQVLVVVDQQDPPARARTGFVALRLIVFPHGLAQGGHELIGRDRLGEVCGRTGRERVITVARGVAAAHDHDRYARQLRQRVQSPHDGRALSSRQAHVEDDRLRLELDRGAHGGYGVERRGHFVPAAPQRPREDQEQVLIVVDEQDEARGGHPSAASAEVAAGRGAPGSVSVARKPAPGSLASCEGAAVALREPAAHPEADPQAGRLEPRARARRGSRTRRPGRAPPESSRARCRRPRQSPSRSPRRPVTRTATVPASGAYVVAFRTRSVMICRTSSRSAQARGEGDAPGSTTTTGPALMLSAAQRHDALGQVGRDDLARERQERPSTPSSRCRPHRSPVPRAARRCARARRDTRAAAA